jgi:hypothetical protein
MDDQDDQIDKERRQHARFDFCDKLSFQIAVSAEQSLPHGEGGAPMEERPSALIKNVGGRGCCLTLDRPLKESQIIKMDFPLVQAVLSIPTLAEVRWVCLQPGLNQYTVGLRFLL